MAIDPVECKRVLAVHEIVVSRVQKLGGGRPASPPHYTPRLALCMFITMMIVGPVQERDVESIRQVTLVQHHCHYR